MTTDERLAAIEKTAGETHEAVQELVRLFMKQAGATDHLTKVCELAAARAQLAIDDLLRQNEVQRHHTSEIRRLDARVTQLEEAGDGGSSENGGI